MFGLGTVINTAAVVSGGVLGVTLKKGIPESCRQVLMQACGVATIFIGAGGVLSKMLVIRGDQLETQDTMLLILSLVIGGLIGSLLDIEKRLDTLGNFLKRLFHTEGDSQFVEGFVTCTLVICIGAMAIVSAIEDGLTGNISTLTAKAALDFVIVVVFASTGQRCHFCRASALCLPGSDHLRCCCLRKLYERRADQPSFLYWFRTDFLCRRKYRIRKKIRSGEPAARSDHSHILFSDKITAEGIPKAIETAGRIPSPDIS